MLPSDSQRPVYAFEFLNILRQESRDVKRRDVLRWTGMASALAVAGCVSGDDESDDASGEDGGSTPTPDETPTPEPTATPEPTDDEGTGEEESGGGDGASEEIDYTDPVEVVEVFVTAWQDGDVETMNSLVAEDGNFEQIQEDNAEEVAAQAPIIKEVQTVDEADESASVEAMLALPDAEEPLSGTFDLVAVDGKWRIYDILPTAQKYAPSVDFEFDVNDGAMTITHTAGDAVSAGELFVRGDGLERTGVWYKLSEEHGENDDVKAGDSLTITVEDEYSVSVVWDDDEHSATLSAVSGASDSESAGEGPVDKYLADTDNYDGSVADLTGQDEVIVEVVTDDDTDQINFFDPPAIRIDQGTEVTWEWVGSGAHTVTHEDGEFDSGVLDGEGTEFSHTFDESGTYLYFCAPHKPLGMKGAVVVE
jgi:halocyanin-like protein